MAIKEIKYDPKKRTYTGTDNNDIMDAATLGYFVPTEGKDKGKGLTITGEKGDDTIIGSTGNDTISGGVGDDKITGSLGDDKITGGKGKDIFIFTKEEGVDTITDADKDDTIRITGTSADKLKYGKQGNNLEIYYDSSMDENNKIVVQNYFTKFMKGQQPQIEVWEEEVDEYPQNVMVENYSITGKGSITGTKLNDDIIGSSSKDTIKAIGGIDKIEGRGGNDTLYAGTTADSQTTFIFKPGDGQDVVNSGKGEDTLLFNDVENLSFEQGTKNKKDLIIRYSNNENDFVTVKNYFTVDKQGFVNGINSKNSIKHFIVNAQEINSGFIIGTAEKDRIYTYGNTTVNKIYACDGNDLINIYVDNITAYGGSGCDNVSVNASGTTVYGGDGNDRISSFGTNNIIVGGKGNDRLSVSGNYMSEEEYQTVFIFNKGDGNDSLTSWANHSVLKFADSSLSDLKLERLGDALIIKYNFGKDSVMLRAFYGYDTGEYSLVDKNGQEKSLDDFIADYKTIPAFSAKKFVGNKDNDDFRLEDVENIIVDASDGNDSMSVTATGTTIYGGNGNDKIGIAGANNTVYGGKGNDRFYVNQYYYGDSFEDYMDSQATFVFKKGDGNDRFLTYSQGDSVLKFADSLLSNITLEKFGDSLVIKYNSGKDSIMLEGYYSEEGKGTYTLIDKKGQEKTLEDFISEYKSIPNSSTTEIIGTNYDDDIKVRADNITVYGNKGNDTISINASGTTVYGGDGSDEIYVLGGTNNTIYGGKGNELFSGLYNDYKSFATLIFDTGDGHDVIRNDIGSIAVQLNTKSDLKFTHNECNNNLVMFYGNGDSITMEDYFMNNSHSVKTIKNGDETLTLQQAIDKYKHGIDISDTYTIGKNDGDIILNSGTNIKNIIFAYENDIENLQFISAVKDLIIKYNNGENTVTLKDFVISFNSVQNIIINENVYNIIESKLYGTDPLIINSPSYNEIIGGYGDDTLVGYSTSSHTFYGGFGNDTIYAGGTVMISSSSDGISYGGYSDETVYGGEGNDTIYCAGGNSSVKNYIYGGNGNDQIYGGKGEDYIFGEAGNDLIKGRAGNDILAGGEGNDTIYGDTAYSIYPDTGNDILFGGNGNNYLDGGNGSDEYALFNDGFMRTTSEHSTINDNGSSGEDLVVVYSSPQNISIWFDYNQEEDYMFRIKDLDNSTDNNATLSGIEKIVATIDGINFKTYQYKNAELKSEVLSWLALNSFTDVSSVMSNGTEEQQQSILAIFNNSDNWQYAS